MQEADKEDAVLIAITRDGQIWLSPGNSKIGLDQIASKVKDLQAARTGDKTVYIKADARARFGSVTDVIDQLRTDGVDQLGLLTEEIQDKNKRGLSL
jgi:biopolymer transport protein ExbD/biopolymer transport protein TolR